MSGIQHANRGWSELDVNNNANNVNSPDPNITSQSKLTPVRIGKQLDGVDKMARELNLHITNSDVEAVIVGTPIGDAFYFLGIVVPLSAMNGKLIKHNRWHGRYGLNNNLGRYCKHVVAPSVNIFSSDWTEGMFREEPSTDTMTFPGSTTGRELINFSWDMLYNGITMPVSAYTDATNYEWFQNTNDMYLIPFLQETSDNDSSLDLFEDVELKVDLGYTVNDLCISKGIYSENAVTHTVSKTEN